MPQAYLHDIPVDLFIKYYLNNENDIDAISANARYQPVYVSDIATRYYTYTYTDSKDINYSIKTINPLPFDIGTIGRKIFNTNPEETVTSVSPELTETGMQLFAKLDRSKPENILKRDTQSNNINDSFINNNVYNDILSSENDLFKEESRKYIFEDVAAQVYYLPIDDAVGTFFNNLSLYPYYGKIKDHVYYSLIKDEYDQFRYVVDEVDNVTKSLTEFEGSSMRIDTANIYQDPDYGNISYYSVTNARTKREIGKIYILEPHYVLDYNEAGLAHFVDTYKAPNSEHYDLYFNENDMPISPIMKYHLYMRDYKSALVTALNDPTSDVTKFTKTNELIYKEFNDHDEIGYSYKFLERITTPILLTSAASVSYAYPQNLATSVSTLVSSLVSTLSQISISNIASKLLFSTSLSTALKKSVKTASSTTVVANGAKAKNTSSAAISKSIKVDLSNSNTSIASALKNSAAGNRITVKTTNRVAAKSSTQLKKYANELVYTYDGAVGTMLTDVINNLKNGKATNILFNTNNLYKLNVLTSGGVTINNNYAVSADAKAATERDHALQNIIREILNGNSIPNSNIVSQYSNLLSIADPIDGALYKILNTSEVTISGDSPTQIIYPENSVFKCVYRDGSPTFELYEEITYKMPSFGFKIIDIPVNITHSISPILEKTKFFLYRNNIFVIEFNNIRVNSVVVKSIYRYLYDKITGINNSIEFDNGTLTTVSQNVNQNTQTITTMDMSIYNTDILTKLSEHFGDLNTFEDNDALLKLKRVFNSLNYYEKSSVHAMDRVSENILLDKYKTSFKNITENTMKSKDSNIFASSAVTDKFNMYIYANSLYNNLIKTIETTPVKNTGGMCYDYKSGNSYNGFINYSNDLVTFNYIKANESVSDSSEHITLGSPITLSEEDRNALMATIKNQNYIKRLLNYKKYNLNAEEFNRRYNSELYHKNYKNIIETKDINETYLNLNKETKTYNENVFKMSDIVEKSISLYVEYLYSNNITTVNRGSNDIDNVDSDKSFNRRTLPLYLDKILKENNMFILDNNSDYQLKHIFSDTDDDKKLFIESLEQKLIRGE